MKKSGSKDLANSDLEVVLARIQHYCAYQERCNEEVESKLIQWKVAPVRIRKIKILLNREGYIDEERFARIFACGKFHINKWGRIKIRHELKIRKIPETLIQKALEEIGDDDYRRTIHELILKKMSEIKISKHLNMREKIITFVTGKGFEFDLIIKVLTELKI
ncbi:MAG: regulatory protein RecX [Bacteroidales bacterium]